MEMYRITTELFSIPWEDKYIIYAPLRRLAFLVTPGVVNLLHKISIKGDQSSLRKKERESLKPFLELGLINGKIEKVLAHVNTEFMPTYVTLFLTNRCNLRCIYCYASGGEKQEATLPVEIAKSAIDFVIKNTLLKNQKVFGIGFHGGGEPTLAWTTLEACVEYAKGRASEKGLNGNLYLATNGIMSREKLDWIMANFTGITLSLDGPESIQNYHRPFFNGKGSFGKVMETVKRMNERNFSYGVRTTVTDKSVGYMDEIVEFIANTCRTKRIHLEPTFTCGRCAHSGIESPSADEFIKGFRKAQKVAESLKVAVFYSGARLDTLTTIFCKAAGSSFCVTPDGDVTSCYEVCSKDDPRSEIFFYGRYDGKQMKFVFSEEKLAYLRNRTVNNISFCEDCFCKYHCAGDCLAKASGEKNLLTINNFTRCKINQTLTLDQIVKILNKGEIKN